MAKKKYYCVKVGKTPGIYPDWDSCKAQVDGYPGAKYKGFATLQEANEYMGIQENGQQLQMSFDTENTSEDKMESVMSEQIDSAVAYVDGSYNIETGEYGCGVVFFYQGEEIHIKDKGADEELATMRNVAGEILGSTLAMKYALEHNIKKLAIYYDYQGIASWPLGEWKTNKEGTIAYKQFYDEIKNQLQVEFCKVKGHSGDRWNDLADELAKQSVGVI